MSILAPARPIVKPAARKPRPFGLGIFPQRAERLPIGPSAEDRAWAEYFLNVDCTDYDVALPSDAEIAAEAARYAEEAAWADACERGYVPA